MCFSIKFLDLDSRGGNFSIHYFYIESKKVITLFFLNALITWSYKFFRIVLSLFHAVHKEAQ